MITDFSARTKIRGHVWISSQMIDNIQSLNLWPDSGTSFRDDLYSRLRIDFYKVYRTEELAVELPR